MATFETHAMGPWEKINDPAVYPGDAEMVIGCLQRLATIMEGIRSELEFLNQPRRSKVEAAEKAKRAIADAERVRLRSIMSPVLRAIATLEDDAALTAAQRRAASAVWMGISRACAWLYEDDLRSISATPAERLVDDHYLSGVGPKTKAAWKSLFDGTRTVTWPPIIWPEPEAKETP